MPPSLLAPGVLPPGLPPEFSLIARHFRPLAGPGARDLADDVALVAPPAGRDLVITADAMVAGVHFLPDDPPDQVGQKLLRVNLSDLAGKGAIPLGYLLTVAAPRGTDDAWFGAFAQGLAQDQPRFGITLLGGDTTSTSGPVTLSLTAIGHAPAGRVPCRTGAAPDDEVWVTGTIGDGALGLQAALGRLTDPTGHLLRRYRLPEPRLGLPVWEFASASMDVSDGLVQDLEHICRASGVSAEIDALAVPRSAAARQAGEAWLITCLTGGDDYELLFAVPPGRVDALRHAAEAARIAVTRIGTFRAGDPDVTVRDADGRAIEIAHRGWSHF